MWIYPERFSKFVPRLGGMHTLMNFVGAVGTLMAESGLAEIMQATFGGVTKMLSGKKFPQNVRALCMVVEELLQDILSGESCTYLERMETLKERSTISHTAKVSLDKLIKPVFIMMLFV